MKIGFIGVGMMGGPMCLNLLKAGHAVVACDLNPESLKRVMAAGAEKANSPREVAEQCLVVMTSLPKPADVDAVVLGENGLAQGAQAETLVVDLTTNAPASVKNLAEALGRKGIAFMDAPVSGGVTGAEAATLAIMCGGRQADFNRAKPLLDCMGSNVVHVGEVGSGSIAKLCNNMTSFCNLAIAAEALMLGQRAGVNPRVLAGVMQTASGASFALKRLERKGLKGDYNAEFSLDLAFKDLALGMQLGAETETPLSFAPITQALMEKSKALGRGGEDLMTIQRILEEALNEELRG